MSVPPTGAMLAGKYALGRRLGSGGYGSVYECENVDLGKKVAIKLIDRRHKTSMEAIGRFRREARASAKIESPNIVQVFDVGEDEVFGLYMVMELLRGEDLRRKLDRAGHLEVDFAADVAHQIACGLAKAHAAGVVHRDLKPANIFLHQPSAEAGEADETRIVAKIVDFGVAKLLDGAAIGDSVVRQPLTSAGKTVGTPQYMAPEQVQGLPYDHRGDLWALGALLYEMLTGAPAYALRPTFQETALAIVNDRPVPISTLAPGVPPALHAVVDRALSHDPDARFPDATAFADALMTAVPSAFANNERIDARVAELVSVRPPRTSSPSRPSGPTSSDSSVVPLVEPPEHRRRAGAIIAIAILAAAAGILVLAALRNTKRPPVAEAPATAATPASSVQPSASPVVSASAEPVVAPVPSAEPSTAPSTTPSVVVKTVAKPAVPSATADAPAPKPAPKEPDQFGGVGVSSSF